MRSDALIVFSIKRSSRSSSLSLEQGVVDCVRGGLSGGGAKGSLDCKGVVRARFWAVSDDSWTESSIVIGLLPLPRVLRVWEGILNVLYG
jgi:hypothetical protein